ncbi:YcbK family protein [Phyllobacterium lublinensis]|uniref:YcbK family protein n=1 Tax=Phyllobacterium lublinensis TaxID=2875708 RepID=UPI001CCD4AA2|nr:YcbK family protein [Phyllobacterium sp. 2063]MBZ9653694.1 YcbK family protein [Phyllobacterium sp. 2063]
MNILPASVSALRASTVACVIAIAAMAATSCTSTGPTPSVTSALNAAAENEPAGNAKQTADASLPSGGHQSVSTQALALAGSTETNALQAINDAAAKPADPKAAGATTAANQQPATTVEDKSQVKTSLFGFSGAAKPAESQQVASAATAAAAPARTSLFGGSAKAEPAEQPAHAQETQQPAAQKADKDKTADAKAAEVASSQQPVAAVNKPAGKNNGALLRLFSNNQGRSAANRQVAVIEPKSQPRLRASEAAVQTASALPSADSFAGKTEHLSSLPGVRPNAGIQIMQRDSLYDDDDVEAAAAPVILASAAGLARLAPNGLKVQRESVQVACLKPQLVGILKTLERRYGKSVIVTSGYRSPPYNRLVNGAKASLHMSCAAADIQIPGISKWELASFARSMQGRGGVGTYCHTESVHVDIGPRRDWNWRCSRGRA